MDTNALPKYDATDNATGCCPRFKPAGWDNAELHFQDKLFVRATTRSIVHVPLNMRTVFRKTFKSIEDAGAHSDDDFIVMSREQSAWSAEHLFSVKREVPGQEMVRLSGDFTTMVFEGPYKEVPRWHEQVVEKAKARGKATGHVYFFYTTCPKCAKAYGRNYVIAVAQVDSLRRSQH